MPTCKNCGEQLEGDGYTAVYHCPNAVELKSDEIAIAEPDANVIYCATDMRANPLTSDERKWLKKLEKLMCSCPSDRLACYTTGGRDLEFYDKNVAKEWLDRQGFKVTYSAMDDAYQAHKLAGSALWFIKTNFDIDSCSG